MRPELPGQLGLFADPEPESCPHEMGRYRTKTECGLAGRPIWTNCREAGHCVLGGGVVEGSLMLVGGDPGIG